MSTLDAWRLFCLLVALGFAIYALAETVAAIVCYQAEDEEEGTTEADPEPEADQPELARGPWWI
jgi:hypothetical protein